MFHVSKKRIFSGLNICFASPDIFGLKESGLKEVYKKYVNIAIEKEAPDHEHVFWCISIT